MRLTAVLTVAAAMWVSHAGAQTIPWQPPRLTPGWVFTPTIMVGGVWDSNVTVRSAGEEHVREWAGTLGPRGELDYNGRRLKFNAGYSGELEAYSDVSELNRYAQHARAYSQYQPTARLQIEARSSYIDTPSTDRLDMGRLPFLDVGGRSFDLVGGFRFRQTSRTSIEGDYRFQHMSFDQEVTPVRPAFLADGEVHGPVARVTQLLTRRFSVGGEWQYQRATIANGLQDFTVQTMLGQAGYRFTPQTAISGGAGAAYLEMASTGIGVWGPSLRASLSHQVDRTTLSAGYSRSFVPSFGFGGLTGNQELIVTASTPITRNGRMTAFGSVSYNRAEPVEALGQDFRLDSLSTHATLGYQVSRWLRAEGFIVNMHQTSTARGRFDRTRVGIQFVTFKPVRIQ